MTCRNRNGIQRSLYRSYVMFFNTSTTLLLFLKGLQNWLWGLFHQRLDYGSYSKVNWKITHFWPTLLTVLWIVKQGGLFNNPLPLHDWIDLLLCFLYFWSEQWNNPHDMRDQAVWQNLCISFSSGPWKEAIYLSNPRLMWAGWGSVASRNLLIILQI